MKGYKVFNSDWTCRGYRFEVGKTFEEDVKPECCNRGFHFCTKASDCFNYYKFDPNNKVAEVDAVGVIDAYSNGTKCSTNKLHIIREITWQEVLELVNTGKACTGLCNSGDKNSGDKNSGDKNSGDYNSGDYNSGSYNSGHYNSGHYNSGNHNSGSCNGGDYNSGNCNSGRYNSGNCNSGDKNSGNYNSGNYNSGNYNSGNHNSGSYNSGHYNSGHYNKASNVAGCFNTQSRKLMFFDKETDMTFEQWEKSEACCLMNGIGFRPADWIQSNEMSDVEKIEHPEHETTGGYLKICDNTECYIKWWNGLSERNKDIIRSIPNFDSEKFYQITGIRA